MPVCSGGGTPQGPDEVVFVDGMAFCRSDPGNGHASCVEDVVIDMGLLYAEQLDDRSAYWSMKSLVGQGVVDQVTHGDS